MGKYFLILWILTAFWCCSKNTHKQSENLPEKPESEVNNLNKLPQPTPYPPNSVQVLAEFMHFEEGEKDRVCLLKIKKILGYGPATPPISPEKILKVGVDSHLFESTLWQKIHTGTIVKAKLSYQKHMSIEKDQPAWLLTKIEIEK